MANITITIPDEYVNRVLNSFTWATEQNHLSYNGSFRPYEFKISSKLESETNLVFGKRVIRELLLGLVKTHELNVDYKRYIDEVNSIVEATENVPNEVII